MLLAAKTVNMIGVFPSVIVSQMSVGLLLVKLVGLSIVYPSFYCRQSVVCKVRIVVGNSLVVFVLL